MDFCYSRTKELDSRQSIDRFFGELFFTITETSRALILAKEPENLNEYALYVTVYLPVFAKT